MKKWINGELLEMTPEETVAFSLKAAGETPREPGLAELLASFSDAQIIAALKEVLQ